MMLPSLHGLYTANLITLLYLALNPLQSTLVGLIFHIKVREAFRLTHSRFYVLLDCVN